ncbi:DinB family protein [Emticicia sp. CRIBPO]|uniref:DinB family protein n=1 Tax=Emticicia sp. CRIBPO TaxID=2683258 RepID=UPI001411DC34|nr:DinB family protein [Emticicia sp. CRIBPO]NBA87860.1 DinB family protein [Emticicia sp. CRIBPO]
MKRSDINPMPEYFDRYINTVDDVELEEALNISLEELKNLPADQWKVIGDKVYEEGKWTIRDIIQHLIDTERIFTYRSLCFARDEASRLPSFDEVSYAKNALATQRSLQELISELIVVRTSFIALYRSFTAEMLAKTGLSFKGPYSVASIGFIMAGHQRWHLRIIEERYLPLI